MALEKSNTQNKLILKLEENKLLKKIAYDELREKIKVLDKQIKLQKEVESLKLTALKSQIKPHFIFNALNSIKLYINKNDTNKASKYLDRFARLIRKILEVSSLDYISLEEELEIIQLYIDIENTRLTTPVHTNISIDSSINSTQIKVPSLILQPFVENAIWHGLATKEGDKQIDIYITATYNSIKIKIDDNGIGRKKRKELQEGKITQNKSLGIKLIQDRLYNLYGTPNTIEIIDLADNQNKPKGTTVNIKLNKHKK